ncbi:MAG: helix-turn-helix transcriptional regulator [Fimbriimonadaceae bacterium]|nr:helix-turn-helix transcriptional regulator [Fimbriimonadaceae bacterium]
MPTKRAEYAVLGAVIRQERENFGLSQRALARKTGRTETSIGKIEAGYQRVDLVELLDIARALRVELTQIVATFEEETRKSG